jgi:type IV secretory pathway TraG/TraD family ATPase VirD4
VRFLTVWHSVAQLRRHYGQDAAAEILALCQAKVFLGSITDDFTRDYIVELLGRRQQLGEQTRAGRGVDVMTAQALQRTSTGEGLLIHRREGLVRSRPSTRAGSLSPLPPTVEATTG